MSHQDKISLLISFILALFLWGYAKVEILPNERTRIITNVPVILTGTSPEGYTTSLTNDSRLIRIKVRGPIDIVNNLTVDDIKVMVSKENITDPETKVQLAAKNIELPDEDLSVISPPQVVLNTVRLEQVVMPVVVSFVSEPPPGSVVGRYVITPSEVSVEGVKKAIEKLAYVQVRIDPNKKLENKTSLKLYAVDADGEQLTDVRILTPTVTVKMVALTTTFE